MFLLQYEQTGQRFFPSSIFSFREFYHAILHRLVRICLMLTKLFYRLLAVLDESYETMTHRQSPPTI